MPDYGTGARKAPSKGSMDPRWWTWTSDPKYRKLERCHEHVFPPAELRPFLPDGDPNPLCRGPEEVKNGPLVLAHTLVEGRCRDCQEAGKPRGPADAETRARETKPPEPPPLALFADPEPEVVEPSEDDQAELDRFRFRTTRG